MNPYHVKLKEQIDVIQQQVGGDPKTVAAFQYLFEFLTEIDTTLETVVRHRD